MSSLIVEVCQIDNIKSHSNADKLELAEIKGWQCVVPKGKYIAKQNVIFVPPDAMIPKDVSDKWGVTNYLSSKGRVKSIKLRGEPSFGIIIDNESDWPIGYDCASDFGITKYEPPQWTIKGNTAPKHPLWVRYTEIEHLRNFSRVLDGKEVICTEKIHGANTSIAMLDGELVVSSRNLNRQPPYRPVNKRYTGINRIWNPRRWFNPNYTENVVDEIAKDNDWFWHATSSLYGVIDLLKELSQKYKQVIVYGEIYGSDVQDLSYGVKGLCWRAFDILIDGKYVDANEFYNYCGKYNIPTAPRLYEGVYDLERIIALSRGNTNINGAEHIREGLVVKCIKEESQPRVGRLIFKYINDDYLIRQSSETAVDHSEN